MTTLSSSNMETTQITTKGSTLDKQSAEAITTTSARTSIHSNKLMTSLSSPKMETIQITTKRSAFDKGPDGGMSLNIFSSNAPFWYRFSLYAVLGCVSVVIIGLLSICCKTCWAALAKRGDDDDDEEERKKYKEYNNRRFRAPRVKPLRVMTMQNI
ncbi:uncharacterized protein LOC134276656 isoform X1 [Saccostrea cucullata]|uniref:uncharacterized protein LOC134276656 isoform X1 n=1 Tax=Saccostrea cuccullata TaxID=36930 RepID=UPI002ED29F29